MVNKFAELRRFLSYAVKSAETQISDIERINGSEQLKWYYAGMRDAYELAKARGAIIANSED